MTPDQLAPFVGAKIRAEIQAFDGALNDVARNIRNVRECLRREDFVWQTIT
jgi:hypothetical protein